MLQDNRREDIRGVRDTLQGDIREEGIHAGEGTLLEGSPVADIQLEDSHGEDSHGEDMVQKGNLHDEGNALLQQHTQQD